MSIPSLRPSRYRRVAAVTVAIAGAAALAAPATAVPRDAGRHVLVVSVDGLHQSDLDWYVSTHPHSELAALVGGGTSYQHAETPVPSDSFPGMIGQFTGGNPATTGIWYDDTYNRSLLPAGTTNCAGAKPGTEVALTEAADKDQTALDAGQGLTGLPGSILDMTGDPASLLNPAALPVDPTTCKPVYPHQYLRVNTVFEVARQAGLRTAWSDKHPAYEILNGPSGTGVQDLFTPEINSQAIGYPAGDDWTSDNAATQQYDSDKVQAVRNEIDGYDHSGRTKVGVPAVFGLNFQTVSTAQKLPTSDGMTGGYLADGVTPGPLLSSALDYIDRSMATLATEIHRRGLDGSTTIILSAKHGQSPTAPADLLRVPDGPILDGLNSAWQAAHPGAGPLVAQSTDDDLMLLWLTDHSQAAADFAKAYLLAHNGTGNDVDQQPVPYTASGLTTVYAGRAAAGYFHTSPGDPRVPDLVGIARHGVVFTGGHAKIAEHGGADPQDRDVPLVVTPLSSRHGGTVTAPVETTQVAPTILALLHLDPDSLQAVRKEHTQVLPGL